MPTSAVWKEVEQLLADGVSVIPVRDKEEKLPTRTMGPKTPYSTWKKYQTSIISKEELWYEMDKRNTDAIATICGAVSGNLEAIDIDTKFKPGIEKDYFDLLLNSCPEILKLLRINRTPSGGYHLLYRISDHAPEGNEKLAGREATPEELAIKPKDKVKYYLETRGEGGYVVAPPSLGYSKAKDLPIPVITWEQRNQLINAAHLLSDVTEDDRPRYDPATRTESDYYDVNPFEDYNKREGENALHECGWKFLYKTAKASLWQRPDSKSGGEHAAFLFNSRLFFFFTTQTSLKQNRCYQPATVLAEFKYGGDKKKLRAALVSQGFGKLKPEREKSIVKRAVLSGMELPGNISEEGQQEYDETKQAMAETLAYGRFWKMGEKELEIDREEFYAVAANMGFRLHDGDLVQIVGNLIHRRDERFFYDSMKSTIQDTDANLVHDIFNIYESFIQKNGQFSIGRIKMLEQDIVLNDTKNECYKFYENGYIFITGDTVEYNTYSDVPGLIWAERIQPRSYIKGELGGKVLEFLHLAVNFGDNADYIHRIFGYLAHEYKDESTGFIIVLTEECPDPKQGGGSGKNVFSNLLKLTTTFTSKPGSQVKFDEKFLQSWNHQRIFCVSDVPKGFDFLFLKELSTGDGLLKKLYKDEVTVLCKDMPKFLIQTNYSYEVKDGGLARRIKQIEFTNFFTQVGGVDIHFGGMFPNDWNEQDWIGYDRFVIESIQTWLRCGRKIPAKELTKSGWQKQFDQTYNELLRIFIEERWEKWCEMEIVASADLMRQYDEYCQENSINVKYKSSSRTINSALVDYGKKRGYDVEPNKSARPNGMLDQCKCKVFTPSEAPF